MVASDAVAEHPATLVGETVARAWLAAAPASRLAVVPLAAGGEAWVSALARVWDADTEVLAADGSVLLTSRRGADVALAVAGPSDGQAGAEEGFWARPGSHPHGRALAAGLAGGARRVLLDLTTSTAHDAGEGLLAELGGLAAARARTSGVELVGVVAAEELAQPLLGLRGITARRGHAGPTAPDPGRLVELDAALERFARGVAPEAADLPGAGAAGGCGFAVLALGGRLVSGPQLLAEESGLPATLAAADLVVTATTSLDFASRGGAVVQAVAGWAGEALRPCVVLAGSVQIGAREMRLMGVESAHALGPVPLAGRPARVDLAALGDLVARVARSWDRTAG
nr:glycerate kinase [Auraticoccus cholistanensis]